MKGNLFETRMRASGVQRYIHKDLRISLQRTDEHKTSLSTTETENLANLAPTIMNVLKW